MFDDEDDVRPVLRDGAGRFQPGSRPLSSGRPAMSPEMREALEAISPAAVARLAQLVHSEDERVALAAAEALLNRLYGRAPQQINADVRTSSVGELHLQYMQEIQARREARLRAAETIEG